MIVKHKKEDYSHYANERIMKVFCESVPKMRCSTVKGSDTRGVKSEASI